MLFLIPFFPLLGFCLNASRSLLFNSRWQEKDYGLVSGFIGTFCIFLSFLVSVYFFIQFQGMPANERFFEEVLWNWMNIGNYSQTLDISLGLRLDALSILFALVITGIGTLIHLYSIEYMHHDATPTKFFAYLNLFCFAMLILVLGANLPVLFLGWEGVGLCSYLLIGYWYSDEQKVKAGKKAFIVNRIGDVGFLLGMFLLFQSIGSLDFQVIASQVGQGKISVEIMTSVGLLFLLGCLGKSAQIPLFVWLPDAMAGPTPVSALIHAATMVTSGIYLISRLSPLYSHTPVALHWMAWIGIATAFFGATVAVRQNDIKKVLAYSTVSQLGYMFLGCGVGAFGAGVFHVITHAFFKALLFLGAGSVIHALGEEQDITKMGGLRSRLPITWMTFAAGWLSICGIPPYCGFFSKDEILFQSYHSPLGGVWFWILGVLTAGLTAFYMTRLYCAVFLGQNRCPERPIHPPSHWIQVPLQILAVFCLVIGFIGIPHQNWLEHWLSHSIVSPIAEDSGVHHLEWLLMGMNLMVIFVSVFLAFRKYQQPDAWQSHGLQKKDFIFRMKSFFENKWYIDEFYDLCLVRPIQKISVLLWKKVDSILIDGFFMLFAKSFWWLGSGLRMTQTGSVQTYAVVLLLGMVLIVGYFFYVG